MTDSLKNYVTYEDFGAKGDAETDDIRAILAAHAYANEHRLPVKTRWDATYYIGGEACPVPIETDTDWGSSHFVIDDRRAADNKAPVFLVRSRLSAFTPDIQTLKKDQVFLPPISDIDCVVYVENHAVKHYIRYGPNVNNGTDQSDVFILRKDGTIDSPIDWDYEEVTKAEAFPIDKEPLTIRGGVFTTIANQGPSVYNYYERNIQITRSNTKVSGLVHYVAGELSHGSPYNGFIRAYLCADITFEDLFLTGHKMYFTIGAAGRPVPMGSYDLRAGKVCNFTMKNCRTENILDRSRWGTIATDFCKNIRLDGCRLSRVDTHQGVSGVYELKNSVFGHMGVKAIGRGRILMENCTSYGDEFLELRPDYGSTWDGTIDIRNCRYIPSCGDMCTPHILHVQNAGIHDFGYPCRMGSEIRIDGLEILDDSVPEGYAGPFFCTDPDLPSGYEEGPLPDVRPFPYVLPDKLFLRKIRSSSGKALRMCENPQLSEALMKRQEP